MENFIIILAVIPVSFVLWLLFAGDMSKTVYVCEKCGKRFRAKWYCFLLSGHYGEDKVLKCPECGEKHRCVVSHDQKL